MENNQLTKPSRRISAGFPKKKSGIAEQAEIPLLGKKEKYFLKKQRKEEERASRVKQRKTKKIISISLPIIIAGGIIFGLVVYFSGEKEIDASGTPQIEITESQYNAGAVSMADGLVKHTYELKNKGLGDLKIDRIWTSCMCTTARLTVGEEESPKFGMHNNPVFWSQKIASEKTGYLEVSFDPAFHGPKGTGSVMRTVYLSTNDPKNKKAEVKMLVNVRP